MQGFDLFLSAAGGATVDEPAADLGMALAIASTIDPDGPAPSDEQWIASFRETAMSEAVLASTLTYMDRADSGAVRIASNTEELAAHLSDHLTVQGTAGRGELLYRTANKDEAKPVLEALTKATAIAMTIHDNEEFGEPRTEVNQSAALIPHPVANGRVDQLKLSGIIFAGLALVGVGAWLLMRMMMLRSKRMFGDDQLPQLTSLDKPETWSPLPASHLEDA